MRSASVDPLPPVLPTLARPIPLLKISTILAQGLLSNPQRKGRARGGETDREEGKEGQGPAEGVRERLQTQGEPAETGRGSVEEKEGKGGKTWRPRRMRERCRDRDGSHAGRET